MSFWWSPLLPGGGLLGAAQPDPAPTLAEGTTLAAMQAGSFSAKYTVAIEGYQYLLTDATTQQAADAWYDAIADSYYTQALGGLYVKCDNQQQLDWKKPFTRGGSLTLHVVPDSAGDTFGTDTHKRGGSGAETELTATIDRDDTTITVKSTTGFASSGEIWIGTECIGYTGTTATTFTGCVRGKYAPLAREDGPGFAQHHRVGEGALEVLLNPRVTSYPRSWVNKWVAVRLHKYDASIPALNSKDDALIVFAGKIVAITDDPNTGATVVEVKHALDVIADTTIGGQDQWSGKIRNTIFLQPGMTFRMKDFKLGSASKTANDLTVEVGAAGDNEVEAGEYSIVAIYEFLSSWLAKERVAGRLYGTYTFGLHTPDDGSIQTYIWWGQDGSATSDTIYFELLWPALIAARLGYVSQLPTGTTKVIKTFAMSLLASPPKSGGTDFNSEVSDDNLMRFIASGYGATPGSRATVVDTQGTFSDQWETLPGSVKPAATTADGYGIFLLDERVIVVGYKDGSYIYDPFVLPDQFGLGDSSLDATNWRIPWRQDGPDYVPIRQIFVIETTLQQILLKLIRSTGTAGYNDSENDEFGYGIGAAIPYEITAMLEGSTVLLPHADMPIVVLIDKPTPIAKLLDGELMLRRAFMRWKNGTLEVGTWMTPDSAMSVATLTEANKAAPAGNVDHHRSVTTEDGSWAFPIVKIQYNRSLKGSPDGSDLYRDSLVIVDSAALNDLGGSGGTLVINARGTLGDFASTGSTPGSLAAGFMSSMPYFSRPARRTSRSIDQRYFEGYAIGDIVTWTDEYARDPDTGARGVVTRHGIITRHRYSLGGPNVNSDSVDPQGGDVDLFSLDVNRNGAYVPCAQVDDTETNGGYTDATKTLICYEHKYSRNSEAVDASHFVAGDKVRIVEIDPSDPAAPLQWERTIDSVSSNSIVFTAALALPAWDSAKKYRIVFDDYGDAVTAQQLKTFQADDTDGMITDVRVPYEYVTGWADRNYALWTGSDPVELPPNSSYGDGVGLDVGHDIALGRLLNNLQNYKTCVSSPCLNNSVLDSGDLTGIGTWACHQVRPVWIGDDRLLNDVYRNIAVAPMFCSSTGASVSARVTISRSPPRGTSSIWVDIDRGNIISSTTFTTTGTTMVTPTAVELDARVKNFDGVVWVYLELSSLGQSWGLAHLQVTSLRVLHDLVPTTTLPIWDVIGHALT